MIKFEYTEVVGWEHSIRGMRNAKNSWEKSDSYYCLGPVCPDDATVNTCRDECRFYKTIDCENNVSCPYIIGPNDYKLAMKLGNAGPVHGKYRRMLEVYVDITAPMFWWSEFDTYKVGTVRNSCSKMHTIHIKPFDINDFTHGGCHEVDYAYGALLAVIDTCERLRQDFNKTGDKKYWRALIELLPESYNMRATIKLSYEVLANMYEYRHDHKLDEWREFCKWIESLPYSELITGSMSLKYAELGKSLAKGFADGITERTGGEQ